MLQDLLTSSIRGEVPREVHDFGTRQTILQLGPRRRRFSLDLAGVDPSSADFTVLEDVVESGALSPFWYWPPDTENPGPYLVQLDGDAKVRQESKVPQKRIEYRFQLEMIEATE